MSPSLGSITEFASQENKNPLDLGKWYLLSCARELLPDHRIGICWRYVRSGAATVDIVHLPLQRRGYVKNLMHCGQGWICPVCALRITEARREELQAALARIRQDYFPIMATYTMSHTKKDSLAALLKKMSEAFRFLKSGREWQELKDEYLIAGSIRALEVTYGANGWHPHYHEIMLIKNTPEMRRSVTWPIILETGEQIGEKFDFQAFGDSLNNQLSRRWTYVLGSMGGYASWEHGVSVTTQGGDIAAYVQKYGYLPVDDCRWTIAHEATKGRVKKTNLDGVTPFGLLAQYGGGDERAGRLFVEYSQAIKGRSCLQWSKGLKALCGVGELTDDQILAKDEDQQAEILAKISRETWHKIAARNLIPAIVAAADLRQADRIEQIVASIEAETVVFELPGQMIDQY